MRHSSVISTCILAAAIVAQLAVVATPATGAQTSADTGAPVAHGASEYGIGPAILIDLQIDDNSLLGQTATLTATLTAAYGEVNDVVLHVDTTSGVTAIAPPLAPFSLSPEDSKHTQVLLHVTDLGTQLVKVTAVGEENGLQAEGYRQMFLVVGDDGTATHVDHLPISPYADYDANALPMGLSNGGPVPASSPGPDAPPTAQLPPATNLPP
jgi:hypothetical protein